MTLEEDQRWMAIALAEAKRGLGLTSPNPPVGAVIVQGKEIVAKGFHQGDGLAHAEIMALEHAGRDGSEGQLIGSTIYVTLEPCSTEGRTGACCQAIIAAGVARVVYGCDDPFPGHGGAAQRALESSGLSVSSGILEDDCRELIRGFASRVQHGRPLVIAKVGASLDGRLVRPPGESQWLTSPEARSDAMGLRAVCDAIIIGGETARLDRPRLTLRGPSAERGMKNPLRVVVSASGDLPMDSPLFADSNEAETLVWGTRGESLPELFAELGRRGCNQVLVEGGGRLHGALFREGLVDELVWYTAPLISGGGASSVSVDQWDDSHRWASCQLEWVETKMVGGAIRSRARVVRARK